MNVSERVAEMEAMIESLLAENEELRRRPFAPRADEGAEPGPGALLSPRQVAERTGLSPHAIYRAIKDGELKAMNLRGRLRVRPEDLEAWLDAQTVKPPEPEKERRGRRSSARRGSFAAELKEIEELRGIRQAGSLARPKAIERTPRAIREGKA